MSPADTRPEHVATWSDLADREPTHVRVEGCGHDSLSGFERRDLTTWEKDIADLTGIEYAGVGHDR